jgi:hypothetical protein
MSMTRSRNTVERPSQLLGVDDEGVIAELGAAAELEATDVEGADVEAHARDDSSSASREREVVQVRLATAPEHGLPRDVPALGDDVVQVVDEEP